MSGKRTNSWKLEKETINWINSLELPIEHAEFNRISRSSEKDTKSIKQHYDSLIRSGLKTWMESHRKRIVRRLTLKAAEISSGIHMSDFKLRQCLQRWKHFVENSYLTIAAVTYIEKKYCNKMNFYYKLSLSLHYWRIRVLHRRRMKGQYWKLWKHRCNGYALLTKVWYCSIVYHYDIW